MNAHDTIPNCVPSNLSRDAREAVRRDFKEIYRICDERLNFLREMIHNSETYLKHDEARERDQMKEEEEKEMRLRTL